MYRFCFGALAVLALSLPTGCASSVAVPRSNADFRLYVDVTPKDSAILVDGAPVGNGLRSAEVPLEILAGTRRISIERDGYHTFRTTLEYIQPGETYTLKTTLIASEF